MGDTKMVSSRPLSLMEAMSVYWGFVSVYYRNGISKISVNAGVGSLTICLRNEMSSSSEQLAP